MLWQDEANNSPLHMIEASKTLFMDVVPLIYLEIIGSTFTYCAWKLDQFTHFFLTYKTFGCQKRMQL